MKPHIKMVGGMYRCATNLTAAGYGRTALAAYNRWSFFNRWFFR